MFDEQLARRIRGELHGIPDVGERRMFGRLAFLIGGHMTWGVVGTDLMLRLGKTGTDAALEEPSVRPMDFTGRPIRSMVYVARAGTATDHALNAWIRRALQFRPNAPAQDLTASTTAGLNVQTPRRSAAAREIARRATVGWLDKRSVAASRRVRPGVGLDRVLPVGAPGQGARIAKVGVDPGCCLRAGHRV